MVNLSVMPGGELTDELLSAGKQFLACGNIMAWPLNNTNGLMLSRYGCNIHLNINQLCEMQIS
jgi:hypothetical protein